MDDRLGKARYLIGTRWTPWVIVVMLALLVSIFEAVGAILLFALLGLMTDADAGLVLPLLGDIRPHIAGIEDRSLYLGAAGVIAVFFVVRGSVTVAQTYAQTRVTENAGARLSSLLHRGYLAMPYSDRGEQDTAEQVRNAHDTVKRFVEGLFLPIVMIVSEAVLIVALLGVLLVTAPIATLLVVGIVGSVVLLLNRLVQPRLQRLGRELQDLSRESLRLLQESLQGRDEIRLLGRAGHFAGRFRSVRRGIARDMYLKETLGRLPTVGLETALVLFVAVFLAVTVLLEREAAEIVPVLGLFGYVGLRLLPSLERTVFYLNVLRFTEPALDDIYAEVRKVEPWLPDGDRAEEVTPLPVEDAITLDGVTFRYPRGEADAIRDVDLRIEAGRWIGLVGPTGGGKSTLVDLIVGLRRPAAGEVRVDGIDIHEHLPAWFASIGVVQQRVFLVDDTIRRNIALGIDDDAVDEDRLRTALEVAQIDGFVTSLPEGLDTAVGEHGLRLSGGQRQRIAIARALYRDPPVVVLDEGTAALDTATESRLIGALDELHGRRTLLLVAHRLASVRDCDVIHVVVDGRIIASGTYDELLERSADFRSLVVGPDRGSAAEISAEGGRLVDGDGSPHGEEGREPDAGDRDEP